MDPVSIFVGYVATQISKSKSFTEAKDELFKASWEWMKPLFIKDDTALEEFKDNPDDALNIKDVELKISKHLRKNPASQSELEEFVSRILSQGPSNIRVVNQHHTGSGDNIAGDKITGSKYE